MFKWLRLGTSQEFPNSSSIQLCSEGYCQCSEVRKKDKNINIWKKNKKYHYLHIERLLELMSEAISWNQNHYVKSVHK